VTGVQTCALPISGCKSNREKAQSLCYEKCADVHGKCFDTIPGIPTNCKPLRGLTYQPPVSDKPCGSGYVYDGQNSCNNNYVPKTYAKSNAAIQCPNDHSKVAGLCYEKCPKIEETVNGKKTTIQLGHIDAGLGFCAPPKNGKYPPFYTVEGAPFSFPGIYTKVRKIAMSTKNSQGGVTS
jgi:hypothetical protein